jgi:hypothetical protein
MGSHGMATAWNYPAARAPVLAPARMRRRAALKIFLTETSSQHGRDSVMSGARLIAITAGVAETYIAPVTATVSKATIPSPTRCDARSTVNAAHPDKVDITTSGTVTVPSQNHSLPLTTFVTTFVASQTLKHVRCNALNAATHVAKSRGIVTIQAKLG